MKYFAWADRQSHPVRDADGRESTRHVEPPSATSLHLGGGCGSVHTGEAGRIEICEACLLPAVRAGLKTETVEDAKPAPKKKDGAES